MINKETRTSPTGSYALSDLEALKGSELAAIYNLIASNLNAATIRKFKDKDTGIARTWDALLAYQNWLGSDDAAVVNASDLKSVTEQIATEVPVNDKYPTRENWLDAAVALLSERFFKPEDLELPKNLKVGIGFSGGEKAIGTCFKGDVTENDTTHIFICPTLGKDVTRVLDVLLHEMIHAALNLTNPDHKHGPEFRKVAVGFGLTGKMTATVVEEGSDLDLNLQDLAEELGVYPHSPIILKKQKAAPVVSKWVGFTSIADPKYKVDANIDRVIEHGRPRDYNGDPMIATKDEVEMRLLDEGVDPIKE